jgi:hypothetical protein
MTEKLKTTAEQREGWRVGLTAYLIRCDYAGRLAAFLSDALEDIDALVTRSADTVDKTTVKVTKAILERICGMVYATRAEQSRLDYITDKEYLELVRLRHGGCGSVETVLTALSGSRAAQKESEGWIDIKEEEPDDQAECHIAVPLFDSGDRTFKRYEIFHATYHAQERGSYFTTCDGEDFDAGDEATHWRPLPAPPAATESKGESE